MGVAAMTLAGGEYAIHGTNMPGSVGGFVSYDCIRSGHFRSVRARERRHDGGCDPLTGLRWPA